MNFKKRLISKKAPAYFINIGNIILMIVMLIVTAASTQSTFNVFLIGAGGGFVNFVLMFVYISEKNVSAYISNIIWMLLMPIIGFGCCAANFEI